MGAVAPAEAGWIPESVVHDLGLKEHGLAVTTAASSLVSLREGAAPLVLSSDVAKTRASIAAMSEADAAKWEAFAGQMDRLTAFLESLFEVPAVELMETAPSELLSLAGHGLRLRRMGKTDMVEFLRVLPMSLRDLLDDWFESDALKAAVAITGLRNLFQGPMSAGTGFTLLHAQAGHALGAFGARSFATAEQGHVVLALRAALKKLGVEVRTNAAATVTVESGRAVGVTLASGEKLTAKAVASGADPRRACLTQVAPQHLPPEFVKPVKHVKLRGVRAFLLLAVDKVPAFRGVSDDQLKSTLVVAPGIEMLERAFDAAKHGDLPEHPSLEITIPSLHDNSLAPAGKHVVHVAIQCVPYHLRKRAWDDAARAAIEERVLAELEKHAPGLSATVVGTKLITPVDLERDYGLTEGHLHGGELTLDQILFMRPVGGWARSATPLPGYFLCGDATHPGGGMVGLAGRHAANAIAATS
jgi:phytoene dehydrogenase-like protein